MWFWTLLCGWCLKKDVVIPILGEKSGPIVWYVVVLMFFRRCTRVGGVTEEDRMMQIQRD